MYHILNIGHSANFLHITLIPDTKNVSGSFFSFFMYQIWYKQFYRVKVTQYESGKFVGKLHWINDEWCLSQTTFINITELLQTQLVQLESAESRKNHIRVTLRSKTVVSFIESMWHCYVLFTPNVIQPASSLASSSDFIFMVFHWDMAIINFVACKSMSFTNDLKDREMLTMLKIGLLPRPRRENGILFLVQFVSSFVSLFGF